MIRHRVSQSLLGVAVCAASAMAQASETLSLKPAEPLRRGQEKTVAQKDDPLIARIQEFLRLLAAENREAAQSSLAPDARIWFDKKEGPGNPWRLGSGPWASWDKFFNARRTYQDWQVEGRDILSEGIEPDQVVEAEEAPVLGPSRLGLASAQDAQYRRAAEMLAARSNR
jgi:hypothetical protein